MIRYADIRNMTITDLGKLAEEIRSAKPGSKKARQLADRMCAASMYLEDSSALGQLVWWARDVELEAPPDGKAEVIEFKVTKERTPPFLIL